jgi:hypothetical protein
MAASVSQYKKQRVSIFFGSGPRVDSDVHRWALLIKTTRIDRNLKLNKKYKSNSDARWYPQHMSSPFYIFLFHSKKQELNTLLSRPRLSYTMCA